MLIQVWMTNFIDDIRIEEHTKIIMVWEFDLILLIKDEWYKSGWLIMWMASILKNAPKPWPFNLNRVVLQAACTNLDWKSTQTKTAWFESCNNAGCLYKSGLTNYVNSTEVCRKLSLWTCDGGTIFTFVESLCEQNFCWYIHNRGHLNINSFPVTLCFLCSLQSYN